MPPVLTLLQDVDVTIRNLDLAEVNDRIDQNGAVVVTPDPANDEDGSDANPKTITVPSGMNTVTLRAVHKSSGLQDNRDNRNGRTGGFDPDGVCRTRGELQRQQHT